MTISSPVFVAVKCDPDVADNFASEDLILKQEPKEEPDKHLTCISSHLYYSEQSQHYNVNHKTNLFVQNTYSSHSPAVPIFPTTVNGKFPSKVHAEKPQQSKKPCRTMEDGKSEDLVCILCGKSFKSLKNLKRHVNVHGCERSFGCSHCSWAFKTKYALERHTQFVHVTDKPFKCELCDASFWQEVSLKKHVAQHVNDKPFLCVECNISFPHISSYNKHLAFHAPKQKHKYKCEFCDKILQTKYNHERHIMFKHSKNAIPLTCMLCDIKFSSRSSLKRHISLHMNEKFPCKACDKKFTWYNLKVHNNRYIKSGRSCAGNMVMDQNESSVAAQVMLLLNIYKLNCWDNSLGSTTPKVHITFLPPLLSASCPPPPFRASSHPLHISISSCPSLSLLALILPFTTQVPDPYLNIGTWYTLYHSRPDF
uniref:C2H2-type domain-containing protein n=1 Tax=Timema tahoe TaxID=61484 RepID=A0A7R9ISV6_9NEOP|nr:unnamed protein product [Timema tahoe]